MKFMKPHLQFLLVAVALFYSTVSSAQTAAFTADKTSGCFPLTVNFTDQSTGGVNSWNWSFGNGNSSTLQNPGAVYTSPGTYNVSLTVSNGTQSDPEVKTGYIVVHDYPQVNFIFDKSSGCAPLQIQFTNQVDASAGAITEWFWAFGDGGTSTNPNPLYTYNQAGNQTVALKVKNQFGCEKTETKIGVINVNGPAVSFTPSTLSACQVPVNVDFDNTTTGTGTLTYKWDFGDGGISTQAEPSHTYTQPNVYKVKLTSTDGNGCSAFREVEIKAGSEGGLDFTPSVSKTCKGESVSFTIQPTSVVLSQSWDFGNGTSSNNPTPSVTYSQPGIYKVKLTAQLQGKLCQSIWSKDVEVIADANPTFTNTISCRNEVTFTSTSTNAARLEWYINDVFHSDQITFLYHATAGDLNVKLKVFNSLDCETVRTQVVHVPVIPTAMFTPASERDCLMPSLSVCAPFDLQFENVSLSELNFTSQWNFGDNTSSTNKSPVHKYLNAGNFNISLIITDTRGCKDTATSVVHVSKTIPVANFSIDKTSSCVGEMINFTNSSQNADFLCWDFGDGVKQTGPTPSHSYAEPGIYNLTLIAKNAGCSDTLKITGGVTVKDPKVEFTMQKSCSDPYHVEFTNGSTRADSIHWELSNGVESDDNRFVYTFPSTGTYTVTLSGYNRASKCLVNIERSVNIQEVHAGIDMPNRNPCKGAIVPANDASDFAASWTWVVDNLQVAQTKNAELGFYSAGPHTVELYVTDSDGCPDHAQIAVNVPDITGDFTFDASSDAQCSQLTVDFRDNSTATPAIHSWEWDFGDGGASLLKDPRHIYHALDSFDVKLKITNTQGNCTILKTDAIGFTRPVPDFLVPDPDLCLGESISIVNQTIGAASFHWKLGNGVESNLPSPNDAYSQPGVYNITVEATNKYGCMVPLTKSAVVNVWQPVPDFEAFETSGDCPPLTTIFKDKSTGTNLTFWEWDFGDGKTSIIRDPANVYTKAGVFDVTLRVTDRFGCTDTKVIEDLVHLGGPSGEFSSDASSICVEGVAGFTAITENTVRHQWDFGDGTVTDDEPVTSHPYNSPGAFHPSLIIFDSQGCQVLADGNEVITVHDTTSVSFTFSPKCVFDGGELQLSADSTENLTLTWYLNGVLLGDGSNYAIIPDSAATYDVTLRNTNEFGCVNENVQQVKVHGMITEIPNVFTPNGDEDNQYFEIPGVEFSDWTLRVFNRWGKEVYEEKNYQSDWNGNNLGAGTFYYSLTNQLCPDIHYKGFVTVLK